MKINVTMPDGSVWQVPAQLVGENRLAYYASIGRPVEDEAEAEYLRTDEHEIIDWGRNNMNWEDVQEQAVRLPDRPPPARRGGRSGGDGIHATPRHSRDRLR